MGLRRFAVSIIKSLIVLVVATLIFSSVTLNFPGLIKNVFGDIFAYASPEAQKQTVEKLAEACSSIGQENAVSISQVCTNKSLLDSMKENCRNYRELKRRGAGIENEEQVRETCSQIESGGLEKACSQSSLLPDFSEIGASCRDYKSGKIDDREFFFSVIGSAIPSQQTGMPQIGILGEYNKAVNYLNSNKVIYFVALLALLAALYLLIMDIRLFIATLAQISFSIGVFIMLPYFAILAYDKFVGIDTTPILGSMFGLGTAFEPKAIISVVLLMFLRTYTTFIIITGFMFLAVGIFGKVYSLILRGKSKSAELPEAPKPKKKKS
ncbi:hypothetical protein J4204_04920 [Candidatus Woesearchaeota archaeon]|nr:hypothetical protein [Candidatus Woesearchaeota archaeon]